MSKAYIVMRGNDVVGAIFPERFNLRIVRVPYHDPDRDGMVNGKTHAIALDPAGTAIKAICDSVPGPFYGLQGSKKFLQSQLAGAVDSWNKLHT